VANSAPTATSATTYQTLLSQGNFAGAFQLANQQGDLESFLGNAPSMLATAFPKGMSQSQFQQYYAAFAPYQGELAGKTVPQAQAGNANMQFGAPKTIAQLNELADQQYASDQKLRAAQAAESTAKATPTTYGGSFGGSGTKNSAQENASNATSAYNASVGKTNQYGIGSTSPLPGATVSFDPNILASSQSGGIIQAKPDKTLGADINDIGLAGMIAFTGGALAPVAGAALGGGVAGGVAGGAAVGAGLGAVQTELSGQGSLGKNTLLGAIGGGITNGLSNTVGSELGIGNVGGHIVTGAGAGALKGAINGEGAANGAIGGAVGGAVSGLVGSQTAQSGASSMFGNAGGAVLGAGSGLATGGITSALSNNSGSNMAYGDNGGGSALAFNSNGGGSALATGAASSGGIDGVLGSLVGGGALGSLISGGIGAYGAQNASEQQQAGYGEAGATQQTAMGNISALYGNQLNTGNAAFTSLEGLLNGTSNPSTYLDNTPGYKFAVQQGTQAIDRQAAAGGSAYTPNTLASVGQYVTGTASQNYNNYVNQLMGEAGIGENATGNLSNAMLKTSANISNAQIGGGNAAASGTAGVTGALGGLASSLLGAGSYGAGALGNLFGGGSNSNNSSTNANGSGYGGNGPTYDNTIPNGSVASYGSYQNPPNWDDSGTGNSFNSSGYGS